MRYNVRQHFSLVKPLSRILEGFNKPAQANGLGIVF